MLIELRDFKDTSTFQELTSYLTASGVSFQTVETQDRLLIVLLGSSSLDQSELSSFAKSVYIHSIETEYQLVSKAWRQSCSDLEIDTEVSISRSKLNFVLGPCAIESAEQIEIVAKTLSKLEIPLMRAGAFKPRTSPYSFSGLGIDGLKFTSEIAKSYNIKIVSEVMEVAQISKAIEYVDVFQVGARSIQNYPLLQELGKTKRPVLLKRGLAMTIEEFLQAAEYVYLAGSERIILCERGIRTFESSYRNTLDLNAIPVLKEKTHLPVFVDPSHGIGIRRFVESMSLAAVAAGADGLIIEAHPAPESALSDSQQTLSLEEAQALVNKARSIRGLLCH